MELLNKNQFSVTFKCLSGAKNNYCLPYTSHACHVGVVAYRCVVFTYF